jgi:hypothetical protein
MAHSLTLDPGPRRGDNHEDELYELLKAGEDTTPATSVETNEEASTVGMTQLYDDPKGRESGNADAPWGEKGQQQAGRQEPFHNSEGAWEGHKQTRHGVLGKAFSGLATAAKADQGIIAQNFKTRGYETHSALLEPASKSEQDNKQVKVSHPRGRTLLEQVRGLTGRT